MDNDKLKNLDWMYAKPELQLDDYMLGRKIDKQLIRHVFGDEGDEEERASKTEGASFQQGGLNPTYDQLCKLREDPLIAIKRAEQNKAKEVVDNPVLMKKFKTYLMQMVEDEKSSKKKKKSKKKHKKSRSSSRHSSRSRSPRVENELISQRNKSRAVYKQRQSSTREVEKRHRRDSRSRSRSRSPHNSRSNYISTHRQRRSRSKSRSDPDYKPRRKEDSTKPSGSSNPFKRNASNVKQPSRSGQHASSGFSRGAYIPPKLSAEELERKRQQMMKDAEQHEQVRVKQLKRHEAGLEKEEKEFKDMKYTEDPTRFMKNTMRHDDDVGDRIRAKLNNVQRTKAQEDKFLAK